MRRKLKSGKLKAEIIFAFCFLLSALALPGRNVTIVNPVTKPVPIKVAGAGTVPTPTASPAGTATATPTPTATASAFDPTSIAGLKLWLKADALALSDGATVGTWPDLSGSGNDFGGGVSPIFKTNIVNGKSIVRFNGSTQYLGNQTASIVVGNYTIFVVASSASVSAGSHAVFSTGQVGMFNRSAMIRRDADTLNHFHFDTGYVSAGETSAIVAGAWNVITADWNGSNIHLWRNGTLKNITGSTLIGNTGTSTSIGIDQASGMDAWDGDIAEVLVYNSALSTTDRQNVEAYLKAKYAIP